MTEDKKKQLEAFIEMLSNEQIRDENNLKEYLDDVAYIYQNGTRPSFADIFEIVFPIFSNPARKGDVDVIVSNLDMIISKLRESDQNHVKEVEKLRDQINLELCRYVAYSASINGIEDSQLKAKLNEIEDRVKITDWIVLHQDELDSQIK